MSAIGAKRTLAGAGRAAHVCLRALGLGYGGTPRGNMVFARIVAE